MAARNVSWLKLVTSPAGGRKENQEGEDEDITLEAMVPELYPEGTQEDIQVPSGPSPPLGERAEQSCVVNSLVVRQDGENRSQRAGTLCLVGKPYFIKEALPLPRDALCDFEGPKGKGLKEALFYTGQSRNFPALTS
ncbi:hypothetical protein NDU88_007239 [Pleurodeles waltl]|uniref:Uncharacterized protein n=1 Tax=Pleurodeles waltl TaxID=8319 RepID=A0AAV7WGY5_PLEWA|nr:hypothetical protein NDU88_007239 [Pleurodeles waltl]